MMINGLNSHSSHHDIIMVNVMEDELFLCFYLPNNYVY